MLSRLLQSLPRYINIHERYKRELYQLLSNCFNPIYFYFSTDFSGSLVSEVKKKHALWVEKHGQFIIMNGVKYKTVHSTLHPFQFFFK